MTKVVKYDGRFMEFTYNQPLKEKLYSRVDNSYKTFEEWLFQYEDLIVIGVDFTRNYHVIEKRRSKKGIIGVRYINE